MRLIRGFEYGQDKGNQKIKMLCSLNPATGKIPPISKRVLEERDRRSHKS